MDDSKKPKSTSQENRPKAEENSAPKTIDDIWKEAIEHITTENDISVEKLEGLSGEFKDAERGVDKASRMFENTRHPNDKKDKVATAIGGCLDWVDSTAGFVRDHVSGTYATPAQIVAGAVSYMVQAAKDMTDDFDLIDQTFESIYNALQDVGQLRGHQIIEEHFTNRLMDIFIALFDFCLFSSKMFKKFSRKRLYIRALMKGRNEKIMQKCEQVNHSILLFRATVPLTILGATKHVTEKIDSLPKDFIQALQDMRLKSSDFQTIWEKSRPLEKIAEGFKKYGLNSETKARMDAQMGLIRDHIVPGTFSWLEDDSSYKTWHKAQTTPFLYISGPSGTGKTYLTNYCYYRIQTAAKSNRMSSKNAAKTRQSISVAYFLFDPGKQDSQAFLSVLAAIVFHIADHDPKYCEAIAKDLDNSKNSKTEDNDKQRLKFLWEDLLLKKFERISDSSRLVYILLDGVEQMDDSNFREMMECFQTLNCDKNGIQIMMTGTPELYEKINLKPSRINLVDKIKSGGDVEKIIDDRIEKSENLRSFSAHAHEKIKKYFISSTRSVLSSVGLTLSVMEQSGDENAALDKMENTEKSEGIYGAMIEIVKHKRSQQERQNIETLLWWCVFAKQPLSVYQLQHILSLYPSLGDFDVRSEVQGNLSSILYTAKWKTPDMLDKAEVSPFSDVTETEDLPNTNEGISGVNETMYEYISFRQPAFRDYLEKPRREMSEKPTEAEVDIFLKLCGILCDRGPNKTESRMALQDYATNNLTQHLEDIDTKSTSSQQGRMIVEALSRVMTNENDVSSVFETVMKIRKRNFVGFDLYHYFSTPQPRSDESAGMLLAWAKKMSFHDEEELSPRAKDWVEAVIRKPTEILLDLGHGHIESWARKVTLDDALVPYKLAFRALDTTGMFSEAGSTSRWYWDDGDEITTQTAEKMLEFGKDRSLRTPVKLARARIAAALLLNAADDRKVRKSAEEFYKANLKLDNTPGPERFYSLLGLAEHYSEGDKSQASGEESRRRWKDVQEYADKALKQREYEKGALGSELNNERCIAAFMLRTDALTELDEDVAALETCELALTPGELEFHESILAFLTKIVAIHAKRGEYFKIFEKIQKPSYRIRAEWMGRRTYSPFHKNDLLRKAAVLTRRVDLLVQIYEEAIYYWQSKDTNRARKLQYELSVVYRRDARATKMAGHTLETIITAVRDHPFQLEDGIFQTIFPHVVDIYYENYTVARPKSVKEGIIDKLNELINKLEPTDIVEPIDLARAMITLAKMWKSIGRIQRAKSEAQRAFNICISDLEDSFGWNDSLAFRVLAKVLMFAELKFDAEIALSLQFSQVNRGYDDAVWISDEATDDGSSASSRTSSRLTGPDEGALPSPKDISTPTGKEQEEEAAPHQANADEESAKPRDEKTETEQQETEHITVEAPPDFPLLDIPRTAETSQTEAPPSPPLSNEALNNTDQPETVLSNGTSNTKEDGYASPANIPLPTGTTSPWKSYSTPINDNPPATNILVHLNDILNPDADTKLPPTPHSSKGPLSAGGSNISRVNSNRPSSPSSPSSPSLPRPSSTSVLLVEKPPPAKGRGDILEHWTLTCDGPCNSPTFAISKIKSGQPYWYYCLDCPEVDFCPACHKVQREFYTDTGEGFWFKCCWAEHQYLEQPIKEYRGVRDGVIRIGGKSRPYTDWLDAVKDKWQRKLAVMN